MCIGEREEIRTDSVLVVVPESLRCEGTRDKQTGLRIGGMWRLVRVERTFVVSGETDLVGGRDTKSFAT